ncbi:MAG TPA: hypothetical protein VIL86_18800 [Tepidisphaeraceae bacterium]|jgi:hypothetical protein
MASKSGQPVSPEAIARRHEPTDVRIRPFIIFVSFFLLSAVVIHLLLWWMTGTYVSNEKLRDPERSPVAETLPAPPAPNLQPSIMHNTSPYQDLAEMRQRDENRLRSYGWIDATAGVAHIPIDRAMDLVIERGLPAAPATQPATGGGR